MAKHHSLPLNCPPRCLSRVQAAAYIGISPSLFDELVKVGQMPKPFHLNRRQLWDRYKLDATISDLSDMSDRNPIDEVLGL